MIETSAADYYLEYLKLANCTLDQAFYTKIQSILETTNWDEPTTATDLNNFAVVMLIQAEQNPDLSMRYLHLELALEALNKGIELYGNPLCIAHLAIALNLIGETNQSREIAFSNFIAHLQATYTQSQRIQSGLVYFPLIKKGLKKAPEQQLLEILQVEDGYTQAILLLGIAFYQSQPFLYSGFGLRLLQFAAQLFPHSPLMALKLGISSINNNQWEGLLYLHKANQSSSNSSLSLQALYLAYRDLNQLENAKFWFNAARDKQQKYPNSKEWQWTQLKEDSSFTYISFDEDLLLAVEPSFRSIVTSVLMSEGDWFEKEMEYWRTVIKPGMIVIDVGANVGVYTFSAARRVGSQGRVFAVEPFSGCVRCLQETCQINQLDWVTVCAGAASNQNGTARLSLSAASELNELVSDDATAEMKPGSFEEVNCFTLDSLVEQEHLKQVDFLKIDAEGHEMSVLTGSEKILSHFAPIILYENIAGSKGSNLPVADYLRSKGYELFRYQPFLQALLPVSSVEDLQGNLNIIALPSNINSQNTEFSAVQNI
jgi:FkbM family methyltransferase